MSDTGLEIIYVEAKARLRDQHERVESLSENSRFVLTAASLLVAGFGGLLELVLQAYHPVVSKMTLEVWSPVPTIAIYLALVFCAVKGFTPRSMMDSPSPAGLDAYFFVSARTAKEDLAQAMIVAYQRNTDLMDRKAFWVATAQWLLVIEAAWLTVFVVLRAIF